MLQVNAAVAGEGKSGAVKALDLESSISARLKHDAQHERLRLTHACAQFVVEGLAVLPLRLLERFP